MKNIIGKKFGNLLVIEKVKEEKRVKYLCKCDCGNETRVYKYNLTSGSTKSCGCLRKIPRSLDLTGQTFGRLTVIKKVEKNEYNMNRFLCKCICGNEKVVIGSNLLSGNVRSCGCLRTEVENIIGNKYNKLTVMKLEYNDSGRYYYNCKCDCGTENVIVIKSSLTRGTTKSCGCLRKKSVRIEFEKQKESKLNRKLKGEKVNE